MLKYIIVLVCSVLVSVWVCIKFSLDKQAVISSYNNQLNKCKEDNNAINVLFDAVVEKEIK